MQEMSVVLSGVAARQVSVGWVSITTYQHLSDLCNNLNLFFVIMDLCAMLASRETPQPSCWRVLNPNVAPCCPTWHRAGAV